jgi:hypothetical protein
MDCRNLAKTLAQVATWLAYFCAFFIAVMSVARADGSNDVLLQARAYQFKFRAGDMSVIPPYVALLEEATKAEPDNADLWYAMGVAYLAQGARAMMPGGNPPDAISALQKGRPRSVARFRSSSPAAADAKARLSALDHGRVASSDIKALRNAAGAQCTMCHSR